MKNKYKVQNILMLLLFSSNFLFSQTYDANLSPKIVATSKDFIKSLEQTNSLTKNNITIQSLEKSGVNGVNKVSVSSVNINGNILRNIVHPWTSDQPTYLINLAMTTDVIQRRLFATNLRMSIGGLFDGLYAEKAVAFHLDNIWNRIVFAQKDGAWIKSFGDKPYDNYKFSEPGGMVVDINDTIYVADTRNYCIVKLYYDKTLATLSYVTKFTLPDVLGYSDITIDQTGSLAGNPSNDKFWVLDNFTGQLVCFLRNGTVTQRIYAIQGINCPLKYVDKILVQENPGSASRLALIDHVYANFVIIQPPSNAVYEVTNFDYRLNRLSCIGLDVNNEWWIGDEFQKVYHHFSREGKYLCSYSSAGTPSGEFNRPVTISNAPYYKNGNTIYRSQYVFTSDKWGTTTGIRAFLPGAAIINQPAEIRNNSSSRFSVNFTLTNRSYVKATIIKPLSNGIEQIIKQYDPIIMDANPYAAYYIDNLYIGTSDDEFRIKLEYLPAYEDPANWNLSSSVTIPLLYNQISSYNIVNITPVSPTTSCTNGNGGSWQVSTLYDGPFTYTWYNEQGVKLATGKTINLNNLCPGEVLKCRVNYTDPGNGDNYFWDGEYTNCAMSVSISGPSCLADGQAGSWTASVQGGASSSYKSYSWGYLPSGTTQWLPLDCYSQTLNWNMSSQSVQLRCEVTITSGMCSQSSNSTYYVRMSSNCQLSCPFVFTWDGKAFKEDNNILPQSEYEENVGKDVIDYYRLLKPLKQKNGNYVLQIREYENEKSYFDELKLIAIDHPEYTKIDVAPSSGEVYHYITPYKLSKARVHNQNILTELNDFDSTRIIVEPGDTVNLSLQQPSGKTSHYSIQVGAPGGDEGGGDGLPKTQKMGYNAHPKIISGLDGVLTFRQRPTLVFVPTTLDSNLSLNIVWTERVRLDYLNYGIIVPTPFQKRTLQLISANHSSLGDVRAKLQSTDSNYSTLSPSESIELQFQGLSSPLPGQKRTFVLLSRGRYEHILDSTSLNPTAATQISSFKINNIHPNPFNPSTTISFQQPTSGYTQIIVYDLIGREVARLANGLFAEGIHEVTWDAGNLSSGMYFCRYTVTNSVGRVLHQEVKKLVLTR